jgi:hypothetical protein
MTYEGEKLDRDLRCVQGRFTHIPPLDPRTDYAMDYEKPWWQDPAYIIGRLSYQTRLIRIKNVLLDHTYTMEVCTEFSNSIFLTPRSFPVMGSRKQSQHVNL